MHRSVARSVLNSKAQNKIVQFDKPLTVLEQRDQHKHPSKVIEVEKTDPVFRPKPKKKVVTFVDELDKRNQELIAKQTRTHNPPFTKVWQI